MADERLNAAHLAARLIHARLALPFDCRMVLVLSRMENQDQANLLRRDFNLIVTSGDRSLEAFLRDPHDLGAAMKPDRSIKDVAMRRFDAALRTSQRVFREARARSRQVDTFKAFGSSTSLRRQVPAELPKRSDFVYRPRNRFETPGGPISLLEAARRPGLARQLRCAVDAHLLESWILDTGVPFPLLSETHLAVAAHGLELLRPREGLLTAAAFAGVAVSPTARDDVVEYAVRTAKLTELEAGIPKEISS